MKFTFYKILHQDKKTAARAGEIVTPHGVIKTPCFVPVGTQATVKSLTPEELQKLNVELFFVNTYHAYLRPGIEVIKKFGGLHKFMGWNGPIITDSGGFQVFSLGRKKKYGYTASKTGLTCNSDYKDSQKDFLKNDQRVKVKITDNGVYFQSHWDGSAHTFTPEKSMQLQRDLGSDIHIAFDDCTPYPVTYKQAVASLKRTHEWAERSLAEHNKMKNENIKMSVRAGSSFDRKNDSEKSIINYQALYGVIQGSVFEDLRKTSADFIANSDFDGMAIGGVSVGESKQEMRQVCDWVLPRLPKDKPRHLLGVGEIDDIFDITERGIDTFDCVAPTRLARMGYLYSNHKSQITNHKFLLDITQSKFASDVNPLEKSCGCYACQNFSRAYIHHLFKVRELLAYRLATIHNVHYVINLVKHIRQSIMEDRFLQFKQKFFKIR